MAFCLAIEHALNISHVRTNALTTPKVAFCLEIEHALSIKHGFGIETMPLLSLRFLFAFKWNMRHVRTFRDWRPVFDLDE